MNDSLNIGLDAVDKPGNNIKDLKTALKDIFLSHQRTVLALQTHLKAVSVDHDALANKVEATNANVATNLVSNAESLRIAQTSYVEKKVDDLRSETLKSKTNFVVHKFKVNPGVINASAVKNFIKEKMLGLNAPKHSFTLLKNTAKDNYIPVLFECTLFDDKLELIEILKGEGMVSSPYNPSFLHKFISKAREIYVKADLPNHNIPRNTRHVAIRPTFKCDRLIVLGRNAGDKEWQRLETLGMPIPSKHVSEHFKQTCVSSLVNLDSAIPSDFN